MARGNFQSAQISQVISRSDSNLLVKIYDFIKAAVQNCHDFVTHKIPWIKADSEGVPTFFDSSNKTEILARGEDSALNALLETVEHSKYGWENITPSLLHLGTVLMDTTVPKGSGIRLFVARLMK